VTEKKENKTIFCSFVGTMTNDIRKKLYNTYISDSDFYFNSPRNWSHLISSDNFNEFVETTQKSEFTLCPRGYGKQSFRLYETIQLNSIPVFIYDDDWFPMNDVINWDDFCVNIHVSDIDNIKSILLSYNENDKENILKNGKEIYYKYFTMNGLCEYILDYLTCRSS